MDEIKNAKITDLSITMADHGCLTFFITLEGECWGLNYGGYCIGKGFLGATEFTASAKGLVCMMRIMDTVGVERWEDLKGKYVRIVYPGLCNSVTKIGHITKEKWFDIKDFFSKENIV